MAPTFSAPIPLGSSPPDFKLPATDGRTYQLNDFTESKVLVFAFICNHCPYVIATQDRINHLARETLARGVQFVAINANDAERYPEDNFDAMKVRAREQNFVFPYLRDESQSVARAFGAVCTPEFYVYDNQSKKLTLKYQGRLDDNWKNESAVTQKELAQAIDDVLAGQDPSAEQKPAIGCSIKWKA